MPTFKLLFQRDEEFRIRMTADLELEEEEIGFLLGDKVDSAAVKRVVVEAKQGPANVTVLKKGDDDPKVEAKPEPPKPAPNQARLFSF